jgi:hypothetical protein
MQRLGIVLLALFAVPMVSWAMEINGELKMALLELLASNPTGSEGRVFWDTDDNVARLYNGSGWEDVIAGAIVNADVDASANIAGSKLDTVPYDCAREATASASNATAVDHVCSGSKVAISCGCTQSSSVGATALIVAQRSSSGTQTCSCTRLATPSTVMSATAVCCSP